MLASYPRPPPSPPIKAQRLLGTSGKRIRSEQKMIKQLGMSGEDLYRGRRELEDALKSERMHSPSQHRRQLQQQKATSQAKIGQLLGHDLSSAKLCDKLGVKEDELREASLVEGELFQMRMEQDRPALDSRLVRERGILVRALRRLGVDPSMDKLQRLLCDSDDPAASQKLRAARMALMDVDELSPRSVDSLCRRSPRARPDLLKALDVLGIDPSREKAKELLGASDEQLDHAVQQLESDRCARIRSEAEVRESRTAGPKVKHRLGIQQSSGGIAKLKQRLGSESPELRAAVRATQQRVQQYNSTKQLREHRLNHKVHRTLGSNPSSEKVSKLLSLDKDNKQRQRFQKPESVQQSLQQLARLHADRNRLFFIVFPVCTVLFSFLIYFLYF